jgi:hypothetical protein
MESEMKMTNAQLLQRLTQGVQMAKLEYTTYSRAQLRAVTAAADGSGCVYTTLEDGTKSQIFIAGSPEELAECIQRVALAMPNGR